MDDSASKRSNVEVDKLFDLYLKIESLAFPLTHNNQKKSVIKYARLPDAAKTTNVSCYPTHYTSEPRFRRIITIEEPRVGTRRSLRSEVAVVPRTMTSDMCKRKIITIAEDDENSLHPKFSQEIRKSFKNYIHRAVETDIKEEKQLSQRKVSRLTPTTKSMKILTLDPKDNKSAMKNNIVINKKGTVDSKLGNKYKYSKGDSEIQDYVKNKSYNESTRNNKNAILSPKLSLSKKMVTSHESEKEVSVMKNKYRDDNVPKVPPKKSISEKTKSSRSSTKLYHNRITLLNDKKGKNKPVTIIQVPLDETMMRRDVASEISQDTLTNTEKTLNHVNCAIQAINNTTFKDMSVGTDLVSKKIDQVTETYEDYLNQCFDENKTFDSLDIPNVNLTYNKNDIPKNEIYDMINTNASEVSFINTNSHKSEQKVTDSCFHKSTSYIISRATLTCTTRQKIDFHVVGNNSVLQSHLTSSPFPLNVVSVYKNEIKSKDRSDNYENHGHSRTENKSHDDVEYSNDMTSINSSYIFDNDKLVKPSDLISTIKVNDSLLQSDFICEQFQRELNFIDSFFESLQYLESCSLSDKCLTDKEVENWINTSHELKNLEYGSFLTEFENDVDDTETMASRSLCLLNLLIRDEQRRAKNLLSVLKKREDALKDFTKSQIIWLENKKKHDNIDISTLKKKQRGALLKLQHECGEMQRMRKALLTLSEKRKLALMKTKKNIKLKLRNSVEVEQIILGKRKLKRSTSADRNLAPLKCFELSSSGCDDSTTSRTKSYTPVILSNMATNTTSVEKCVQTGDIIPSLLQVDQSIDAADENFVIVDGSYLNILFRDLLPQIFSSGKQYEVNKEALKNVIHTNSIPHFNLNDDSVMGHLIEQIKNHDLDRPYTPSTARSLVEEFDQIYKDLAEDDRSLENCLDCNFISAIEENKDAVIETNLSKTEESESDEKPNNYQSDEVVLDLSSKISLVDESCTCEPIMVSVGTQSPKERDEEANVSVSGPLPVPAGAADVSDDVAPEVSNWVSQKSSMSATICNDESSLSSHSLSPTISSLNSPVLYEAEELRRQQLAIEREIKALEQQQCQLLAVREIPDKPPPPYTPPIEPRAPKHPRKFVFDEETEQKVRELVTNTESTTFDSDPYEIFLRDYCQESVQQQKLEKNEKYWDTSNFLSSKPQPDSEKLAQKTAQDLKEVLSSVAPTVVSGVGARRSDHIDDILFAEWRRCEPEWTSLHNDEVIVKNQVFESIFQRILTETIDEYKKNIIIANADSN
ncbi:uncharacterized protein PF3D7_1120600-like isoform X1 [Vanessa atalanta]|uniref:uncharacterized protein PF3D7_1120600-like isoform X1 n=1 Tax=Vanessa atalanta TaxID=42275 RepID=UPI001FCE25C4|nr:uncharacterized protein PF3D7_1120600-like isoform X1 [Vanessa atalanta]